MTFTNTYDTGTHVTYYGGTAGKPAEHCRGIVVAGPATTPWTVALVRLVGASGKTSERDVVIQLWGRGPLNEDPTECIVSVMPDGVEAGEWITVKCVAGRYVTGQVVAGPVKELTSKRGVRYLMTTPNGYVRPYNPRWVL